MITVDHFSNADETRRRALLNEFRTETYKGHEYRGIGLGGLPDAREAIEQAMGFRIVPRLQFFRLGAGDDLTVWIHADNSVDAEYAGLWYLTPDEFCAGGTAFWRHREFGWDEVPESGLVPVMARRLNRDGQDESLWERTGLVEMKYNRFIAYPTRVFHSRYPRVVNGDRPENSRLVYVCFFDRRPDPGQPFVLKPDDVPRMTRLGEKFYAEGDLPGRFVPHVFERNWRAWIDGGQGLVVGAEGGAGNLIGVCGGLLAPDPCDGDLVANEMYWFVDPGHRKSGLRLLGAFEDEAKARGAAWVSMVHLANETGERLSGIFARRGYRPLETHHVKEI